MGTNSCAPIATETPICNCRLADRSGSVTGMMWNANDRIFNSFENGDYLQVQGATQYYSGSLQMIVNHIEKSHTRKV